MFVMQKAWMRLRSGCLKDFLVRSCLVELRRGELLFLVRLTNNRDADLTELWRVLKQKKGGGAESKASVFGICDELRLGNISAFVTGE